jgi:hypothetical protein
MPVGHAQPCPELGASDPIATQIRQRMACASPRERQGVIHRAAMASCELTIRATALRARCEAGAGPAVLTAVALVAGICPSLAPDLPLQRGTGSTVELDPERGWVSLDFGRIFLGGAATAPINETALPATHVLLKPLPVFLAEIIRNAFRRQPRARRLGGLFSDTVPRSHELLDGCLGGRLRATTARVRRALPSLAAFTRGRAGALRTRTSSITYAEAGTFRVASRMVWDLADPNSYAEKHLSCSLTCMIWGWGGLSDSSKTG